MAKPAKSPKLPPQHIHRVFSPVMLGSMVLCVALVGTVAYLAFTKTTITVTLNRVANDYSFEFSADELDAEIVSRDVTTTYDVNNFSEGERIPEVATGEVTLYNTHTVDQPLVKTTRLLSQDGVLFRTNETVVVPAGDSVTVAVYADAVGEAGNIPPSSFTIVALRETLQELIYAKSTTAMTGGIVTEVTVTEATINEAIATTEKQLRQIAADVLHDQAQTDAITITPNTVWLTTPDYTTSPELGGVTRAITVTASATATGLAFDRDKLINMIEQETGGTVKKKNFSFDVTVSPDTTIMVSGRAKVVQADDDLSFIDKKKLVNKAESEVRQYLKNYSQVDDVGIQFSPFWLKTTPALERNIIIQAQTK
ncbi:MAG: baseplate J/gp47 family protein [Candidatus Kerfeldbacteria bacterium]|nr:baseplate J/gp47 family protein [Candidatus Kerfeldbacteria bacterium]